MVRRTPDENDQPLPPPATTLEGREEQLIAASIDLIEERIHQKVASAQEVLHFAKQGTVRMKMELEKIHNENIVLQARVKEMEARASSEELMAKALAAFKGYTGEIAVDPEEDDYDDPEL